MEQIELHRHLDVSLRMETLLELAQERGLEAQSTSVENFRERFLLRRPLRDLGEVLGQFVLFQQVLDRPDVLERVAYEVAEDCYREGTRAVELRFSPGFVCHLSGLSWEDALQAFERGLRRASEKHPALRAGLICIGSRDFGMESIEKTIEFYLKERSRFVGIDLAGDEALYPNEKYARLFKPLQAAGARITVHAGEGSGPDSVWAALEWLGATRIGHGIRAIEDPKLMDHLRDRKICLEQCPTSNYITSCVPSLEAHPLPRFLRHGIPVCINTDDPGIFGADLPHEIAVCRTKMGLTDSEIQLTFEHAHQATFL